MTCRDTKAVSRHRPALTPVLAGALMLMLMLMLMPAPSRAGLDRFEPADNAAATGYSAFYVAPVEIDVPPVTTQEASQGRDNLRQKDLKYLSELFDEILTERLAEILPVADGPGKDVLVIHLTLTEVVPNRAAFDRNARGRIAAFQEGVGTTAFEGRIEDGDTGAVIARMGDRYEGRRFSENRNLAFRFGDAEDAFRRWAAQIANRIEPLATSSGN